MTNRACQRCCHDSYPATSYNTRLTPTPCIPNLQSASKLSSQTSWQPPCPWTCHTAVPPWLLFNDIYSELCGWCISLTVSVCQQGWMDGVALIVNHCRLCWLSGSGSNGVSIFPYSTMTNEHVNIHTLTHKHTHLLTHIHLGSQSSPNRPLTVACFTTWGGQAKWHPALWRHYLHTHAAHTAIIHLSLTYCCESTDNLLQSLCAALIAPSASSLPFSHRATLKGYFNMAFFNLTRVASIHRASFGFTASGFEISVYEICASTATQQC